MIGRVTRLVLIPTVLLIIIGFMACSQAQPTAQSPIKPTMQPKTSVAPNPAATKPSTAPQADLPAIGQGTAVGGSGTIAVSNDAKLNFATGGKIEKLSVKKGDRVTKGMTLAKLDTGSLEAALAQAKVNLDQAKLAQTQAETALISAQFTLDKTKAVSDMKDQLTELEWQIKIAEMRIQEVQTSNDNNAVTFWIQQIANYRQDLTKKKKLVSDLLGKAEYSGLITYDILGQTYDRLTVEDMRMKQLQIEAAQKTLDKAPDAIEQAQKNLDLAQKQLNDATIIAPFNGIVATLDVKEGDTVAAPSQAQKPIIYLIDPTTLEIEIGVNELDVPNVKVGQKATVRVDALPGISIEGKVTAISPLPTVQGGIVDYGVTVSFSVPASVDIKVGMNATARIAVK